MGWYEVIPIEFLLILVINYYIIMNNLNEIKCGINYIYTHTNTYYLLLFINFINFPQYN